MLTLAIPPVLSKSGMMCHQVAAVLTYTTAPIAATFGLRNTRSTTDIDTFDDVTGAEDNLALGSYQRR
jgi:hypothetical protein